MSDKVYDPPRGLTNPHIKNLDQYALMCGLVEPLGGSYTLSLIQVDKSFRE
jgi:hypothetical protein